MTIKRTLIIIAIVIVGFVVWDTDRFQKEFFPREYWSKQVAVLEDTVSMDEAMLRDAAIELKKLQMTAKLQVTQEINSAKSLGLSTEEARKEAVEMIRIESQDFRDDMAMWNEMLKKDREELEKARGQFSHYKRGDGRGMGVRLDKWAFLDTLEPITRKLRRQVFEKCIKISDMIIKHPIVKPDRPWR